MAFAGTPRHAEAKRLLSHENNVEVAKPMPFRSRSGLEYLSIYDRDLYLIFKAIEDERTALQEKHNTLRESIKRTVYSTSLFDKLIEMWAEVESFLPASLCAPKPMLPALSVADLNAALRDARIKVGLIKAAKPAPALVIVPVAA
jgi:Nucleotide modification associated domain 5